MWTTVWDELREMIWLVSVIGACQPPLVTFTALMAMELLGCGCMES